MKTFRILILAFSLLAFVQTFSQTTNNLQTPTSVNTDGSPPDASAILDVQSNTHGLLTPRMTTAQRTAIDPAATGLLVYDTDTGSFWYYENNTWNELAPATAPSESGVNPTGIPIPDNDPTGITSTITLTDPDTVATDTRFRVCLDITQTWTSDLDISLEAPDGTAIDLSSDNGGIGDNYTGTCFTTEATSLITGGSAPFTGNWQPEEPFSNFVGKTIAGNWKLKVVDDNPGSTGQLNHWSLQLSQPSATATLLADADGDTRVTVEDLPDEDVVRLEGGGGTARLEVRPDSSVFSGRLRVLGNFVSGDGSNTASGELSFVGGGSSNTVSGSSSFVGGGDFNTASNNDSFVGGGQGNTASGSRSFVGGGADNTASGNRSFVGGGQSLLAKSYAETVFGSYNADYTPNNPSFFDPDDRLFVIGNGTFDNRSNAMTVLKNGQVGIGTTLPTEILHLDGNLRLIDSTIYFRGGADKNHGLGWFGPGKTFDDEAIDGPALFGFSGGVLGTSSSGGANKKIVLSWKSNGNVGIGTTTPANKLDVEGGIVIGASYSGTSTAPTNGAIIEGNVGIGTPPGTSKMAILHGGSGLKLQHSSSAPAFWEFWQSGTSDKLLLLTEAGPVGNFDSPSGTYSATSDLRLKNNISPLASVLPSLMQLQAKRYTYKSDPTGKPHLGFIAQEVETFFPELVTPPSTEGGRETSYLMNYAGFGVIAVQAIQEQQAIIEKQQSEIESLQSQLGEMDQLKSELSTIRAALEKAGIAPD